MRGSNPAFSDFPDHVLSNRPPMLSLSIPYWDLPFLTAPEYWLVYHLSPPQCKFHRNKEVSCLGHQHTPAPRPVMDTLKTDTRLCKHYLSFSWVIPFVIKPQVREVRFSTHPFLCLFSDKSASSPTEATIMQLVSTQELPGGFDAFIQWKEIEKRYLRTISYMQTGSPAVSYLILKAYEVGMCASPLCRWATEAHRGWSRCHSQEVRRQPWDAV